MPASKENGAPITTVVGLSHAKSGFGGISDAEYERFSRFIHTDLGIKMPPAKKTMLQARLQKRLRQLGLESFADYYDYVFSAEGRREELGAMIDAVTTNKTDFFREAHHFDYLTETVLPWFRREAGRGGRRRMQLWSAGCSTGEEPYTLAMVLRGFQERFADFDFAILATDISHRVLKVASAGIYSEADIAPVAMPLRKKYLLRSKDRRKKRVCIAPEVRRRVRFGRLNFMAEDYGIREPMHVIFCRNVVIYFDKATQQKMLQRLYRQMAPGGYLFMGHSESLNGLNLPFKPIVSTIYRKV